MTSNMQSPSWFAQWFNEDYLELYQHRNAADAKRQISLIIKTLQLKANRQKKILDVGCGYGRHIESLYQKGIKAEGIDLSQTLISIGKKKFPYLKLVRQDMRSLPGSASYSYLLSLFTSFGYFSSLEENLNMLSIFYNALAPGGIFWLDFMNASKVLANLPSKPYIKKMQSGNIYTESVCVKANQLVKNITLKIPNNTKPRLYREEVWLLEKPQIENAAKKCGFICKHIFGSYNGTAFNSDSNRLILVFQKS